MGACQSIPVADKEEVVKSTKIDKVLRNDKLQGQNTIKLLLLGTGESGKSTIFKQMQLLYADGFSQYEKTTYRHVVRRNIVESMQTLLQGCQRFGFRLTTDKALEAARHILEVDALAADFWEYKIVDSIKTLWNDAEAVRNTFEQRARLQLPDSAQYLFENIDRIGVDTYSPNKDDILRARLRTSGIVERSFFVHGIEFKFLDVGGQRNERRKWIHCFEEVTAVIFVAAISEYDQVLYEDETENRLLEAIRVFESICNNRYFDETDMIIFLNKIDLFEEKIKRVPLTTCFPEYAGENTYEAGRNFIRDQFVWQNKKPRDIFTHFTCATDTENVERVFSDTRKIILKDNLFKLGLA